MVVPSFTRESTSLHRFELEAEGQSSVSHLEPVTASDKPSPLSFWLVYPPYKESVPPKMNSTWWAPSHFH